MVTVDKEQFNDKMTVIARPIPTPTVSAQQSRNR